MLKLDEGIRVQSKPEAPQALLMVNLQGETGANKLQAAGLKV
jgi:hypothetical protein